MADKNTFLIYGHSFQSKIIALLLTDKSYIEQIQDILEPKYFENKANHWLVKNIKEYFHKYVPLIRTLGQGLGIWNWLPKYILKKKGIFSNAIAREPSLKPDNEQIYELDRMFDRLDL